MFSYITLHVSGSYKELHEFQMHTLHYNTYISGEHSSDSKTKNISGQETVGTGRNLVRTVSFENHM